MQILEKMQQNDLWIIIPYKIQEGIDRKQQLDNLIDHLDQYFINTKLNINIIACEQKDSKLWNAGNVFNSAIKLISGNCDYLIMHSTDVHPIDIDYSYQSYVELMCPKFVKNQCFSSLIKIPYDVFLEINGYSNSYHGWGLEDNDLFLRLRRSNKLIKFNPNNKFNEIKTIDDVHKTYHDEALNNHQLFMKFWYQGERTGTFDGVNEAKTATLLKTIQKTSFLLHFAQVSYD